MVRTLDLDVYAIRRKAGVIGCTQETFADNIGVPVKTVRNWEQRRRSPTGAARVLLWLIDQDPERVVAMLKQPHTAPTA